MDWDGLGYMSSLEQNFNPSVQDIKRRTDLGKSKWRVGTNKVFILLFFEVIPACFRVIYWCLKLWPTCMRTPCSPVLPRLIRLTKTNIDVTCFHFPCTLFEPFLPGMLISCWGVTAANLIRHRHCSRPTLSSTLNSHDVQRPTCSTTCCPPI